MWYMNHTLNELLRKKNHILLPRFKINLLSNILQTRMN
jgi:hypothetical protein